MVSCCSSAALIRFYEASSFKPVKGFNEIENTLELCNKANEIIIQTASQSAKFS